MNKVSEELEEVIFRATFGYDLSKAQVRLLFKEYLRIHNELGQVEHDLEIAKKDASAQREVIAILTQEKL
jgi:hypothetical protein